jgi:hypothetical protein
MITLLFILGFKIYSYGLGDPMNYLLYIERIRGYVKPQHSHIGLLGAPIRLATTIYLIRTPSLDEPILMGKSLYLKGRIAR